MNAVTAQVANPFGSREVAERNAGALVQVEQSRAIAETQAAMMVAKKFPRDPVAAMDRILNACTRPTLAQSALYSYNRGGSDVTGPSIRLAETLAQQWGNFQFGIRELEQRAGESVVEAFAWDIETNTRQTKIFTVKHERHTKKGAYALTDPRDIYEMTANQGARRLRACILGVIPGDVVEAAQQACEKTLAVRVEITPERLAAMLETFAAFGVTKAQIEKRLQCHLEAMKPAQFVNLGKIANSIRDGMSSAGDWFEAEEAPAADGAEAGKTSRAGGLKAAAERAAGKGAKPAEDPPPPQDTSAAASAEDERQRKALLAFFAKTSDPELAALELDAARGKPWYGEAEAAYRAKFSGGEG